MCRLFIYKGIKKSIYELTYVPDNGLLKQSYQKKYTPNLENNVRDTCVNVDGFGIGWYDGDIPYIYVSAKTPWNDINILDLSKYIKTELLFGHIRAVVPFNKHSCVHEWNCHPFKYKNILWMHNGLFENFAGHRKKIIQYIKEDLFNNIKGNTDSEYAFALFLSQFSEEQLGKDIINVEMKILKKYLIDTISILNTFMEDHILSMNFAVTDGTTIFCTRYISDNEIVPPSLYYYSENNNYYISSEPTIKNKQFKLVPKNCLLILSDKIIIEQL